MRIKVIEIQHELASLYMQLCNDNNIAIRNFEIREVGTVSKHVRKNNSGKSYFTPTLAAICWYVPTSPICMARNDLGHWI